MKRISGILALAVATMATVAAMAKQDVEIAAYRLGEDPTLHYGDESLANRVSPLKATVFDKKPRPVAGQTNECSFTVTPQAGEKFTQWVAYEGTDPRRLVVHPKGVTNVVDSAATNFVWTYKSGDANIYIIVDFDYVDYRLEYDASGGSGSLPAEMHSYTNSFTLARASGVLKKKGYTFSGWTNEFVTAAIADGATVTGADLHVDYTNTTVRLYGVWSPGTYSLSFDPGEGEFIEAPGTVTATYDATYPALPEPSLDGYRFSHWYYLANDSEVTVAEGGAVAITEDTLLKAKWVEQVSATFRDGRTGEDIAVVPVDKGSSVKTAPIAPSHAGYHFKEWSPAIGNISQDQTYTALYEPNTYTVVFHAGNGTDDTATQDFVYNADAKELNGIETLGFTRTGYLFAGWLDETSGNLYADGAKVSNLAEEGAFALVAIWKPVKYTIHFEPGDGSGEMDDMVDIEYDEQISLAKCTFSLTNHDFAYWTDANGAVYDDEAEVLNLASESQTLVFTANWAAHVSDLSKAMHCNSLSWENRWPDDESQWIPAKGAGLGYKDSGSEAQVSENNKFMVLYEFPTIGRLTFWWKTAQDSGSDDAPVLWAAVGALESAVEAEDEDGDWKMATFYIEKTDTQMLLSKSGGAGVISIDKMRWEPGAVETTDLSLAIGCDNLKWENSGDNTYSWEVAEGDSIGCDEDGSAAVLEKSGYANDLVATLGSTGTLSFRWMIPEDSGDMVVTCGTSPSSSQQLDGEKGVWNDFSMTNESANVIFSIKVFSTEEGTVYIDHMRWEPDAVAPQSTDKFTVAFDANGGEGGWSKECTYGAVVTPPVVTREGCEFAGWEPAAPATVPEGGITCVAIWKGLKYLVTFDAGENGEGGTSEEIEYGEAISAPVVTREGYTFVEWQPEVAETVPASNLVYTAVWNINSYTVTFKPANGEDDISSVLEYGSAITAPVVAREGYDFAGWTPEVAQSVPSSNVVYAATWNVKSYLVTFDAGEGGEGGWSETLEYGSKLSAPKVKRAGYVFAGWDAEVPSTVPASDITFTAQWTMITGISFTEETASAYEGDAITIVISGGGAKASSVKIHAVYNTATAADLDLKNATLDGEALKNFKFPFQLDWAAGESGVHTLTIPAKADKTVEAPEFFTLQLADATGLDLGDFGIATATIYDAAYDALEAKMENGTATKADTNTWTRLQPKGIYVRALALPADGGKTTGYGVCAEGKKITLKATAASHFKFSRWVDENGETAAETPSLVIDRTTKPASNTKTSTVLTGIDGDTTFYAEFEGDPRVIIASIDTATGKTTGAGRYVPGKKVSVRATPTSSYVFSEWLSGLEPGGQRLSQQATYDFTMPDEEVELTPVFVTKAEDAEYGAALSLDGIDMDADETPLWTHMCGFAVNWPIATDTLSAATVKATGLPSGLKLVQDKVTKNYSITGVPTAASKAGKPSSVKITVTTAAKTTVVYNLSILVLPLPDWAVGTFNGAVFDDIQDMNVTGLVASVTVSAAGKITAKLPTGSFTANAFETADEIDAPAQSSLWNAGDKASIFRTQIVMKSGKTAVTNYFEVTEARVPATATEAGYVTRGEASGEDWLAWQNLWKTEPFKTTIKTLGKAKVIESADGVKLKFAASGAVTASAKFAVTNPQTHKETTHSASCSSVLVPDAEDETLYHVYVAFPPKTANGFAGYGAALAIRWTGDAFVFE